MELAQQNRLRNGQVVWQLLKEAWMAGQVKAAAAAGMGTKALCTKKRATSTSGAWLRKAGCELLQQKWSQTPEVLAEAVSVRAVRSVQQVASEVWMVALLTSSERSPHACFRGNQCRVGWAESPAVVVDCGGGSSAAHQLHNAAPVHFKDLGNAAAGGLVQWCFYLQAAMVGGKAQQSVQQGCGVYLVWELQIWGLWLCEHVHG
jgi:hypothetical protein